MCGTPFAPRSRYTQKLGAFKRKGWRSLLRDEWIVMDASDQEIGFLKEDNAMIATLRRFISLIPQKLPLRGEWGLRLYLQAKLQSVRIQAQHRIPGGFLRFRQAHGLGRRGSAIVLLLGAGASVDAGLPDGRRLVDGFRSAVNEEDRPPLDAVLDALEEHVRPNGVVDVELILSALDSLAAREEQVLSAFVDKGVWQNALP